MSKLYTTKTAALKAVKINSNIVDAKKIFVHPGVGDRTERVNILDLLANNNSGAFVTETWKSEDGNNWYRKYSDGFIIQGGHANMDIDTTFTFPTPFTTTNYNLLLMTRVHKAGTINERWEPTSNTQASIYTGVTGTCPISWLAYGY